MLQHGPETVISSSEQGQIPAPPPPPPPPVAGMRKKAPFVLNEADQAKLSKIQIDVAEKLQVIEALEANVKTLVGSEKKAREQEIKEKISELRKQRKEYSDKILPYTKKIVELENEKDGLTVELKNFVDAITSHHLEPLKNEAEELAASALDYQKRIEKYKENPALASRIPSHVKRLNEIPNELAELYTEIAAHQLTIEQKKKEIEQQIQEKQVLIQEQKKLREPLVRFKDAIRLPKKAIDPNALLPRPEINLSKWQEEGLLDHIHIGILREFIRLQGDPRLEADKVLKKYEELSRNQNGPSGEIPNSAILNEQHILGIMSGYITREPGTYCSSQKIPFKGAVIKEEAKPFLDDLLAEFYGNDKFKAFKQFDSTGLIAKEEGIEVNPTSIAEHLRTEVNHAIAGREVAKLTSAAPAPANSSALQLKKGKGPATELLETTVIATRDAARSDPIKNLEDEQEAKNRIWIRDNPVKVNKRGTEKVLERILLSDEFPDAPQHEKSGIAPNQLNLSMDLIAQLLEAQQQIALLKQQQALELAKQQQACELSAKQQEPSLPEILKKEGLKSWLEAYKIRNKSVPSQRQAQQAWLESGRKDLHIRDVQQQIRSLIPG